MLLINILLSYILFQLESSQKDLATKLDKFMASMTQLMQHNTPNATTNNAATDDFGSTDANSFENTDSIKALNLIDKKLRFTNHLKNTTLLLDNKRVFMQLSNKKMPRPFFSTDKDFVDKYNKLVNTFQEATMNLIKETATETIETVDTKIQEIKTKHRSDPRINEKLNEVTEKCNKTLHRGLISSNSKTLSILDTIPNQSFATTSRNTADSLFSLPKTTTLEVSNVPSKHHLNHNNNRQPSDKNNRHPNYNNNHRPSKNNDRQTNHSNRTVSNNNQSNERPHGHQQQQRKTLNNDNRLDQHTVPYRAQHIQQSYVQCNQQTQQPRTLTGHNTNSNILINNSNNGYYRSNNTPFYNHISVDSDQGQRYQLHSNSTEHYRGVHNYQNQ
jgi:hypothetical protein